jgi:hypothetical protein
MEKAAALQNSAAKNEAAKIELEAASRRTPPGPAVGISPHATLTLKKAALKYQWSAGGGTIPLSEGLWSTGRLHKLGASHSQSLPLHVFPFDSQ